MTQACHIIAKLKNASPASDAVLAEFNFMKADVQSSKTSQAGWKMLFTFGKTQEFQCFLVGCSGQFFQQFTSCNATIYYLTLLFEENLQLDHWLALVMGGVFATIYALATILFFL